MLKNNNRLASYGVTMQNASSSDLGHHKENLTRLGYTVVDSGYSEDEILAIKNSFVVVREQYNEMYGFELLKRKDEHHGVRLPLALNQTFLNLAFNDKILELISCLMGDNFILNQQNCVINPAKKLYNQAAWHRDLPYQHFTSSKPLAINAIYCVDDFTLDNGATKVIPHSHLHEEFPSENYIEENKTQVSAKAGSFIVLDCMLYHAGEINNTNLERRAVNHVYSSPMIKQQIGISDTLLKHYNLSNNQKKILGLNFSPLKSVNEYIQSRPEIND
jgi:hypothetical protein